MTRETYCVPFPGLLELSEVFSGCTVLQKCGCTYIATPPLVLLSRKGKFWTTADAVCGFFTVSSPTSVPQSYKLVARYNSLGKKWSSSGPLRFQPLHACSPMQKHPFDTKTGAIQDVGILGLHLRPGEMNGPFGGMSGNS